MSQDSNKKLKEKKRKNESRGWMQTLRKFNVHRDVMQPSSEFSVALILCCLLLSGLSFQLRWNCSLVDESKHGGD
jgi:hypothetical protein